MNQFEKNQKKKENPLLPRRFQIKQRECEADEEYEMRK